jgi:ubiquinone/menaquinone biosynthesis C-methylase UbiE
MGKSQKELAFLRNLYVETDWTQRFTSLFDDNFKFSDEQKILYVNAGTGNHALALREKLEENAELWAMPENKELLNIAKAKADAVKADISFFSDFPAEKVDAVLADASFVRPAEFKNFLAEIIKLSNKQVMFFLPTAGSFGDIFSYLWETLINAGLLDKEAEIERLIAELPTVSKLEETAENLGLTKLQTETKVELFEFESGEEFVNSPLAADFLFPAWLEFFDEKEKRKVKEKLAQTIDANSDASNFSFSVKATLVVGKKKK